jgi:tetratricopeptide (TPR) repeat protein
VPRATLESEDQWLLDYETDFGDPKWDGKGERPLNTLWIKKAAFNIVMAQQAVRVKKYKAAISYYENALEIFPKIEGLKADLGALYFQTKQFDKALALLGNIPDDELTPEMRNNLGVACLDAKAYDRAEEYLKKAIEGKDKYPEPYKNLALVYKAQNKEDKAIKAFEHYIDLRPNDLDTRHTYALYLTSIERWDIAASVLEKLTEEITDVPNLYFLLARVENKNNQPQKSIEALKRGMLLSDAASALGYMTDKEFDKLRKNKDFKQIIESTKKQKK